MEIENKMLYVRTLAVSLLYISNGLGCVVCVFFSLSFVFWFNYTFIELIVSALYFCYHQLLRHCIRLYVGWFLASFSHCHSHSVRSTQQNFTQDTNAPSIFNWKYLFFFSILFAATIYRIFELWTRNETKEIQAKRKFIEMNCTTRPMYSSSSSDTILQ